MELKLKNIIKSYNGQTVLDVEDLTIKKGSFLGIIGPNGAGKSTVIKIIGGLIDSSDGIVEYNGEVLSSKIQKQMTLVFQKPYLLRTTVFNNIAYPLIIRNVNKVEINRRVNEVMKSLDICYISNQKAWTLSGGEAQKVALARSIVFKPSLLLLDEPTANIDPGSVLILEDNIKKFYKDNKPTIILITHNLQQSRRLCKEVAIIDKGRIIEQDTPENIFTRPSNPLTKKFIEGELVI